jgi:HD-GYP domain-containing protein (c-di-GMP phosphodiesterase class II)
MKKPLMILLSSLCCAASGIESVPIEASLAQASSSIMTANPDKPELSNEDARNAERQRLTLARQALENDYKQAMKLCYQNFDVNSCRLKARDQRIEANTILRKEELRFNAQERQIQAEDARRSLAERNSEAAQKKSEVERAAAIAAAKDRADVSLQKQIDHALQGTKRGDYEQKQREAAQRRADSEKKLRERNKEPAAPLPVPGR